ncbi:MAG: hypothetical protein IJF65_04615 [Clostridia bacterium]|nr:hypothetical protein [Clostridia bacterium]
MNEKGMTIPEAGQLPAAYGALFEELRQALGAMASMIRTTNERMGALEEQVRLLTKVTPAQARAIQDGIRKRAAEQCQMWHLPGQEKAVANAIRKAVRLQTGTSSMKELPRCDYPVVTRQIQMWDDYQVMKAIKKRME